MVFSVPPLDGRPGPGLQTTVCPIRQMDGETEAFVGWFLEVVDVEPFAGVATGVKEWPEPGGVSRQPAVTVEAVGVALAAFNAILERRRKPGGKKPEQAPVSRRRK